MPDEYEVALNRVVASTGWRVPGLGIIGFSTLMGTCRLVTMTD